MIMTLWLAGSLAVLALIDSTSFGTLLIPIWLLLGSERPRVGRMLIYLGTVTGFYFALGMIISFGAYAFMDQIQAALATQAASVVQLLLGVGLFLLSFALDPNRRAKRADGEPGKIARWRQRAMGDASGGGSIPALMGLALGAAAIEAASMLPYLGAIGLITTSGLDLAGRGLSIAGYCVIMILPALVFLVLRLVAHRKVEPLLQKINGWLTKNAAGATSWIVAIVGFLIARDALWRLGGIEWVVDQIGRIT
ncbi:GAP family protein [Microlunatus parietis]|nr:GAP family protein [Microlunatus parietis]